MRATPIGCVFELSAATSRSGRLRNTRDRYDLPASSGPCGGNYHLNAAEGRSWRSVLELVRRFGLRSSQPTEYETWRSALLLRVEFGNLTDAMAPLVLLMDCDNQEAPTTFDSWNPQHALEGSRVQCKQLGDQLLRTDVRHFVDTGFFPRALAHRRRWSTGESPFPNPCAENV